VREYSEGVTDRERSGWGMWHARDICVKYIKKILIGKSEGKGPLGSHTFKWEDNIKVGHT
jgi:hypothetical protein